MTWQALLNRPKAMVVYPLAFSFKHVTCSSLERGLGDAGAAEVAAYLRSEPASSHHLAAIGFHHNAIGPRACRAWA
jgi:hypothetical protein